MRNGFARTLMVIAVSLVLGATVFREPVALAAKAAQEVIVMNDATTPVPVAPSRPFQVSYTGFSAAASTCQDVTLEAGKPFELQAISLRRTTSNTPTNLTLQVSEKTSSISYSTYPLYAFDLAGLYTDKLLRLHVRPNTSAAAANGDIFALAFCWSNPNAPFTNGPSGFLTGQYE